MVLDIGRVCMKIAGRDSNKIAVVIKKLDDNHVLIEGNVRRKKCNIKHLEPLNKILKIKEEETGDNIRELLEKEGFKIDKKGQKREKKQISKK
ncbi:MAG TPA: 50S ribosomal protein L14e [Candidatus Nanoarchaeia archaeon]|nr:50S ribosomal protein L14e [Candidatus Nanoarchaeia archaeon]